MHICLQSCNSISHRINCKYFGGNPIFIIVITYGNKCEILIASNGLFLFKLEINEKICVIATESMTRMNFIGNFRVLLSK